ncbi:MAG: aminotransferase class V-fold PLP-dependent enzyme [Chitinophagaceae bacterium]
MNRRDVVKNLALLNCGSAFIVGGYLKAAPVAKTPGTANDERDFFKELGVRRVINASVTMTFLSGSLMRPEVLQAIHSTSRSFANMYELQDKVGARIAEMLHCEAAMVTSGAACGLLLGTAACITGKDPKKIKNLPFWEGAQKEVVIQKSHRYAFDQAVATTGIRFVEVESIEEMDKAINPNTVMALYYNAAPIVPESILHEDFLRIAKKHGVPAFIDAAADVPPKSNLFLYQKMGFDLVTFSGGKMIRGPQSAGLLFGRKDLIEAARLNHSPYESPIGRPMKVNKEEIFGMYAALKSFLETDEDAQNKLWLERIATIKRALANCGNLAMATYTYPGPANKFPNLDIRWTAQDFKITAEDAVRLLESGEPSIVTTSHDNTLRVGVVLLQEEEIPVVIDRLKNIFSQNKV